MNCYYCGAYLDSMDTCPKCEADVKIWKKIVSISNKLYNDGMERAQVRDLSGAVEYLKMRVIAHLLEHGLALDVGVLGRGLASLVGQGGAGLGALGSLHGLVDGQVLLDELLLQSVEIGADAGGAVVAVLLGERVDVHEDVIDGVLGLLVVHDVFLFTVIEGDILIAEVGADLGEQCGVEGNSDGELGVGEHLPLDGRDLGVHALTDLEGVDLGVAVG